MSHLVNFYDFSHESSVQSYEKEGKKAACLIKSDKCSCYYCCQAICDPNTLATRAERGQRISKCCIHHHYCIYFHLCIKAIRMHLPVDTEKALRIRKLLGMSRLGASSPQHRLDSSSNKLMVSIREQSIYHNETHIQ